VPAGGEAYTDFNYWREKPLDIADFTDSESEGGEDDDDDDDETEAASIRSEDEMGSEIGEDLEASYMSRESLDEMGEGDDYGGMEDSIVESIEGGDYVDRQYEDEEAEDEYDEDEDERTQIEGIAPSIEMGLDTTVERMRELNVKERSPTPRAR
jgi:phosphatidate phosphatase LPIN